MAFELNFRQAILGVSILLFVVSATVTIVWSISMSAMGGMAMPGGWTMSMTWMPGQNLLAAVLSFLGMWIAMMVAMMMPSLVPMLIRYHRDFAMKEVSHPGWHTVLIGAGYFSVWTLFGMAIFPLGVALSDVGMRLPALAREVPFAEGVVVVIAGALQFTSWKTRQLNLCREKPCCDVVISESAGSAWRQGLRFGLHCCQCCFGLMIVLVVIGVMDLRAMAIVAIAITIERLAPAGERVAQSIGIVTVGAGLFLIAQAVV